MSRRPLAVPAGCPPGPYAVRHEKRLRSARLDDGRGNPVGLVDPGAAALLAAAPDLFDALLALRALTGDEDEATQAGAWALADAALDRARGTGGVA